MPDPWPLPPPVAEDAQRVTADAQRVTEDAQRMTQDAQRVTADAQRVTQDAQRVTQDAQRVTADAQRAAGNGPARSKNGLQAADRSRNRWFVRGLRRARGADFFNGLAMPGVGDGPWESNQSPTPSGSRCAGIRTGWGTSASALRESLASASGSVIRVGVTCQMFSAYCRTARSLEK